MGSCPLFICETGSFLQLNFINDIIPHVHLCKRYMAAQKKLLATMPLFLQFFLCEARPRYQTHHKFPWQDKFMQTLFFIKQTTEQYFHSMLEKITKTVLSLTHRVFLLISPSSAAQTLKVYRGEGGRHGVGIISCHNPIWSMSPGQIFNLSVPII